MTEQNDETPLCGAQFGSKSCCLAAGHAPPWHTSRSGSSWPVEVALDATGDGIIQIDPLRDSLVAKLVRDFAAGRLAGAEPDRWTYRWTYIVGSALHKAAVLGMHTGIEKGSIQRQAWKPIRPVTVVEWGGRPQTPTLATEASRWSRCEVTRCEEVRAHYDGEKMSRPPRMPCGCGEHDVRVNGMTIHWLGSHWDADCAFQRALGLLAKALDAKETDE